MPEPAPSRGLRDRPLGKLLLLGLVLAAAFVSARTCASAGRDISGAEAVRLARAHVSFEPCAQKRCARPQFVQRGIPPRPFWLVGFAKALDEDGQPVRTESFLVNAATGEVTRVS